MKKSIKKLLLGLSGLLVLLVGRGFLYLTFAQPYTSYDRYGRLDGSSICETL